MKKLVYYISAVGVTGFLIPGCGSKKENVAAHYNYEVECMGAGMDGTQLLKVWGYGKNPKNAIEKAKKNAVHAVIFKGIAAGQPGCLKKPLAKNPGMEEQHRNYFQSFFAEEGGAYLKFVQVSSDGSIDPKDRLRMKGGYKVGVTVTVNHSLLRQELEAGGIIKKLDSGF